MSKDRWCSCQSEIFDLLLRCCKTADVLVNRSSQTWCWRCWKSSEVLIDGRLLPCCSLTQKSNGVLVSRGTSTWMLTVFWRPMKFYWWQSNDYRNRRRPYPAHGFSIYSVTKNIFTRYTIVQSDTYFRKSFGYKNVGWAKGQLLGRKVCANSNQSHTCGFCASCSAVVLLLLVLIVSDLFLLIEISLGYCGELGTYKAWSEEHRFWRLGFKWWIQSHQPVLILAAFSRVW